MMEVVPGTYEKDEYIETVRMLKCHKNLFIQSVLSVYNEAWKFL